MFGKIAQWSLLFVFVVLLQTTIVPHITIAKTMKPDLVLIALFILALEYGRLGGIWGGFFVGLLLDVYTPSHFGGLALSYTVTGAFIGFFERKKLATEPSLQLVLIMIGGLIMNSVYHFATQGIASAVTAPYLRTFITGFVPSSVYTAILAALVLFIRSTVAPNRIR